MDSLGLLFNISVTAVLFLCFQSASASYFQFIFLSSFHIYNINCSPISYTLHFSWHKYCFFKILFFSTTALICYEVSVFLACHRACNKIQTTFCSWQRLTFHRNLMAQNFILLANILQTSLQSTAKFFLSSLHLLSCCKI